MKTFHKNHAEIRNKNIFFAIDPSDYEAFGGSREKSESREKPKQSAESSKEKINKKCGNLENLEARAGELTGQNIDASASVCSATGMANLAQQASEALGDAIGNKTA